MKELGWDDGRNCRVILRYAEGHIERFPTLIDELVAQQVNVIVVFSDPGIQAALRATTTIPIVATASDMVKSGLAVSLAKPGGNLTGINVLAHELDVKRLEILHEAVVGAKRIGTLADGRMPSGQFELDVAARRLGVDLVLVTPRSPEEVISGLEVLESAHINAVNVLDSPMIFAMRTSIIERLNAAHLPAIFAWPETARLGGLLAYGASIKNELQQIARLVSKILHGARPQDLPIEQPDRYDLVINLNTSKALGLTVPPSLLARADEVIE
jgi:putative ABC transport system substrate-binding protein